MRSPERGDRQQTGPLKAPEVTRISLPLALIPLIFQCIGLADARAAAPGLAEAALRLSAQGNPGRDPAEYLRWLEQAAGVLRQRISGTEPRLQVERLNAFLFEEAGFRVRTQLDSPDYLFLDRVIAGKAGYCAGLATLYLGLGERLEMPLFGVAAPGHVFVRYDDGQLRRNIELTEGGRELPDSEYVRRFRIPEESIKRGVFLRNLSPQEFLAQILNNRGVLASQRGDFEAARTDYDRALGLDPLLQAVYYNRGNDLVLRGKFRKALRDLTRAIDLNSNDFEAWNNCGVCFLKMGEPEKARRDFEQALAINPGFPRAAENLKRLGESRDAE